MCCRDYETVLSEIGGRVETGVWFSGPLKTKIVETIYKARERER